MANKKISFVLPVYNEQQSIAEFYRVLKIHLDTKSKKYDFELLFVNDGSKDDSLQILTKIQRKDDTVKVINFSRNFGHQIGVTAGLDFAEGDAVIIMDTDLQDPPSVAMEMIDKWEEGFEVVYGQRRTRKDSVFKKTTANLFYKLVDKLTTFEIPQNTGDFRLVDRKVVDTLKQFREQNRFMRGLVSYVGFKQYALKFDRDARYAGKTKYPLRKMIKLALDGILGFSTTPLKLITQFGLFVSFISFLGIIYSIYMYFFQPEITVPGWTLMMVAILFIGGVQMIMLGILGEYIGRIYAEVQNRPLYIISDVIKS